MTNQDAQELRNELAAAEGSFLASALDGEWAASRLERLAHLMRLACLETEGAPTLERWMAAGFHELDANLDRYLPAACRVDEDLIADVKEHFMLLASWYFTGVRPMAPEDLEAELAAILQRGPGLRSPSP